MTDIELHELVIKIDDRSKSNTKRLDLLESKHTKSEEVLNNLDKSLSVTIEQIKNIAEDLRTTSINFKEAEMRSNMANARETEALREKYVELDKKIEKVNDKLNKETIEKDAENWKNSKKQILSWVLNAILLIIAAALGISKFL